MVNLKPDQLVVNQKRKTYKNILKKAPDEDY